MAKIAIISDTHCGARNSSNIFMDYMELFYKNVFFPYLEKHNIKNIIHAGDYYEHRKFVNFKALNHNRKVFLEPLRERGITMDIIPGNHDVYFRNTNQLCSLKELLGYFTSSVNIVMEPTVIKYDGFPIALLPWINNENYAKSMRFVNTCDAKVLIGHLELEGFELMKGMPNPHGMEAKPFERFDLTLSGHFHTKSQQGNIHYLGSQYEFNWSDCDDPKFFHVLDTETGELTAVRNPHCLFTKIVYNDEEKDYNQETVEQYANKFVKVIVSKKTDLFTFDRFVDRLQSAGCHEIKIAESFDQYLGESVEDEKISMQDTTDLLDSYVDAVETDLDKDKIKSRLRDLYVEAQNDQIL